jgi:hypothetical protein
MAGAPTTAMARMAMGRIRSTSRKTRGTVKNPLTGRLQAQEIKCIDFFLR